MKITLRGTWVGPPLKKFSNLSMSRTVQADIGISAEMVVIGEAVFSEEARQQDPIGRAVLFKRQWKNINIKFYKTYEIYFGMRTDFLIRPWMDEPNFP